MRQRQALIICWLLLVFVQSCAGIYQATACYSETVTLACSAPNVIWIASSVYGNLDNENKCGDKDPELCELPVGYEQIAAMCEGTTLCTFRVDSAFTQDMCGTNYGAMRIIYDCLDAAQAQAQKISANKGQSISAATIPPARVNNYTDDGILVAIIIIICLGTLGLVAAFLIFWFIIRKRMSFGVKQKDNTEKKVDLKSSPNSYVRFGNNALSSSRA